MTTKYEHWLSTGSGSHQIDLHFQDGDDVEITVNSNWMGLGKNNSIFYCKHHAQSVACGVLYIQKIIENDSVADFSALATVPVYEYIKIPESNVFVHKDDQLFTMKSLGYATWNETFDLMLLLNTFVDVEIEFAEDSHLSTLFRTLDKLKFKQKLESS
jgi:hypothetical protein